MDLSNCSLISQSTKSFAEALATNQHLEELTISGNALSYDGIQHIAHALKVNQGLKKLNLQKCSLTSLSKSFAEAVAANKHLEELDISDNALCDDGLKHLAPGIGVNHNLKILILKKCSLTSLSENFAEAVSANKHLEELNISDNTLCDDGIQHLAHALGVNQGLKKLNLQNCNLTLLSENFAEALATNKHLEELIISDNALCDDGIQHLAHALRINQGLKKLDLCRCSLIPISAKNLAEALSTNKHLEELNISGNPLCDDGIQHLAHALRVNQGLKKLWLMSCGMTDVGFECLAKSLQDNNVLNILKLFNSANHTCDGNKVTKKITTVLIECLKNNHTLTQLVLPKNLGSSAFNIKKAVNDVRNRSGLPLIRVDAGMSIFTVVRTV